MGKRTGVAYPGTIEMVLLEPIETAGMNEDQIPRLIRQTRDAIAHELGKNMGDTEK
jgi:hypothetical protein